MRYLLTILAGTLLLLNAPASAQTCNMLSYNLSSAQTALQRAMDADDLRIGTDAARRAKRELGDVAFAAMDCGCSLAYSEFSTAESRARRASNASTLTEFLEELDRTVRAFNNALDYLRTCSSRR